MDTLKIGDRVVFDTKPWTTLPSVTLIGTLVRLSKNMATIEVTKEQSKDLSGTHRKKVSSITKVNV